MKTLSEEKSREPYLAAEKNMDEKLISVKDAAVQLGILKQSVFKVMKRLGIEGTKRREATAGNQLVSYITYAELDRIAEDTQGSNSSGDESTNDDGFVSADVGVFYLLQLEPDHDPTRFKVGFAANMSDRLRALRCSAPFASVVKTWACKRLWEKTAIDCVTVGCEQLHTEVFRGDSIDDVLAICDAFFDLMPDLSNLGEGDDNNDLADE